MFPLSIPDDDDKLCSAYNMVITALILVTTQVELDELGRLLFSLLVHDAGLQKLSCSCTREAAQRASLCKVPSACASI